MRRSVQAAFAAALYISTMAMSHAVSTTVVIAQVYGGGGNANSQYNYDYVVLRNISSSPVNVSTWSIQYNSTTGVNTWQKTNLTGTIAAGGYYLVQEASNITPAPTSNLPAPDATGSFNMSASGGKVILVNNQTALPGSSNPSSWVDFVGYGAANFYEGSAAPTLSNTTALFRANSGTTDTDNNSADFSTGAPAPVNSGSSATQVVVESAADGSGTTIPNKSISVGTGRNELLRYPQLEQWLRQQRGRDLVAHL